MKKRKRIFVTHLLPRPLIAQHGLSFAANNFSCNLISGGGFDQVFSLMPLFVGGRLSESAFAEEQFKLIYQQSLRGNGWLGRHLASLCEQWQIFRQIPSGASVWFYNLTIHNAFLFLLLKIFQRQTQINFIVLDLTPPFYMFSKNRLFLKLINGAHGRICLSHSELFKRNHSVVLPGVIGIDVNDISPLTKRNNSFLLCGVMNESISQTSIVLRSFAQLPQCELHITGMPDDEDSVKDYAARYPNIIYHGILTSEDYLKLLHRITFVLSTRDPNSPENQCNFPSKILEALFYNRVVISTMKYPQLEGINYFEVPSEMGSFRDSIEQIVQKEYEELAGYMNQSELIYKRFNAGVWNEKMDKIEE